MKKKNTNCMQYAIWIDLQQAMIASMDGDGNIMFESLQSHIETHPRYPGEKSVKQRIFSSTLSMEKHQQNHLKKERQIYLKEVAKHLDRVSSVLILGPADTKFELQKELERQKSFSKARFELRPAGRMKEHELKAMLKPGTYASA